AVPRVLGTAPIPVLGAEPYQRGRRAAGRPRKVPRGGPVAEGPRGDSPAGAPSSAAPRGRPPRGSRVARFLRAVGLSPRGLGRPDLHDPCRTPQSPRSDPPRT